MPCGNCNFFCLRKQCQYIRHFAPFRPLTGLIFHHRHAQPLPLPPAHNLTAAAARAYHSRLKTRTTAAMRSCDGRHNTAPKRERHGNNCVSIANYGLNGV